MVTVTDKILLTTFSYEKSSQETRKSVTARKSNFNVVMMSFYIHDDNIFLYR